MPPQTTTTTTTTTTTPKNYATKRTRIGAAATHVRHQRRRRAVAAAATSNAATVTIVAAADAVCDRLGTTLTIPLALLCFCSTVWASSEPIVIPDCVLAASGGYAYPPPKVQLSVAPARAKYKIPLQLSGHTGSGYLNVDTEKSSESYYESGVGLSQAAHSEKLLQLSTNLATKGGGITYADQPLKTPELKNLLTPAISRQYLPAVTASLTSPGLGKTYTSLSSLPSPAISKSAEYESSAYAYYQSSPTISKTSPYVSPYGPAAIPYGAPYNPKLINSLAATSLTKLDGNLLTAKTAEPLGSYSYAPQLSSTYLSSSGSGAVSHQHVSRPLQQISYAAPAIQKIPTLVAPSVAKVESYAAPAPAYIAPAVKNILAGADYSKYATGGAYSQQQISKPLTAATYLPAVAGPALAPAITQYPSAPVAVHSSSSSENYGASGAVSHQYVSKPIQAVSYASPSAVKVAPIATPLVAPALTHYSTRPSALSSLHAVGGGQSLKYASGGAVSHQYVSKPLQPISYAAAPVAKLPVIALPAVSKVATYAAPAVAQYSSGHGLSSSAVSHQQISTPIQPLVQTYSAPAITKVAAVAPLVAPAITQYSSGVGLSSTHSGSESIKYSSAGAVSHQYVSKPLQPVSYAAAPVAKIPAAVIPAVSKVEAYASPAITQYSSGLGLSQLGGYATSGHGYAGGAISHQHVSKPIQTITYSAPTVSKVAAITPVLKPALTAIHTGAESVKYSGGGAVSHQYVSKPLQTVSYAAAPVAKIAPLAIPAVAAPALTQYSSGHGLSKIVSNYGAYGASGAVSHQQISKPIQTLTYSAPAITKVAAVAPIAAPVLTQYTSGSGLSSIHSGSQSVKYASGGAVSHQYVSKPIQTQEFGLRLPQWAKSYFPHRMQFLTDQSYIYNVYTPEMQKIKAGPFLKKMFTEMLEKREGQLTPSKRKLFIYTGHDTTVVNILSALKIWKRQLPRYSVMTIFELHKNKDTGEYYVEIYFRSHAKAPLEQLTIPGCDFQCPLDKLIELNADVIPTDANNERCSAKNEDFTEPPLRGP
ncbi:uncharacterized protein LOC118747212 [Rhagoletis pomonella]|uniref:uncharacterized protein LOC118747212 n=1 Tax=Rhagoletis pomonella TaxID=28610 RepID=UPI00178085D8|nr:uncharacterized protein LOC118747212 [Rhagoletis pomonella]